MEAILTSVKEKNCKELQMLGQHEEQNQGDTAQGKFFVLLLLFYMLQHAVHVFSVLHTEYIAGIVQISIHCNG